MPDATYQDKVYMEQGAERLVAASGGSIDVESGGEIDLESGAALKLAGSQVTATAAELNILDGVTASAAELNAVADGTPSALTFTPSSTGGTDVTLVTVQVQGSTGNLAAVHNLDLYLSDAATGADLTGTASSGAVAAGAVGVDLETVTAKKHLRVQTDATGKYILSITDSGNTAFYVCAPAPATGVIKISTQLSSTDYGT